MECNGCIVLRDEKQILIVNTKNKNVTPLNVQTDSFIMNPCTNVLGLRAKNKLEIFNLDMKKRIKSTRVNKDENILFWKWLNSHIVAFVTNKAVYHWNMDDSKDPKKKFEKNIVTQTQAQEEKEQTQQVPAQETQFDAEIVNYDASNDLQWLFLQIIRKNKITNENTYVLELYSVEHDKHYVQMNVCNACFTHLINADGKDETLFCFIKQEDAEETEVVAKKQENENKNDDTEDIDKNLKLFIAQIGNDNDDDDDDKINSIKIESDIPVLKNANENENDFIVSMIANDKYCCLYVITQQGYLFIFDVKSGKCVIQHTFPNVCFFVFSFCFLTFIQLNFSLLSCVVCCFLIYFNLNLSTFCCCGALCFLL